METGGAREASGDGLGSTGDVDELNTSVRYLEWPMHA
jgi:hypothetical protein